MDSDGKEMPMVNNYGVAFSSDGKKLAIGGIGTFTLWDITTQKLELRLATSPRGGIDDTILPIAFGVDDKIIAVSYLNTITLWNLATHQPLGALHEGHREIITSLVFSPDGKMLASSSTDNTITLWDVSTLKLIGEPLRIPAPVWVTGLSFSSNGRMLSSGGFGTIILWDVDPQSWYEKACRIAGRNLTYKEWQHYLPDEPYQKTCPQYPEGGGWEQVLFK